MKEEAEDCVALKGSKKNSMPSHGLRPGATEWGQAMRGEPLLPKGGRSLVGPQHALLGTTILIVSSLDFAP
jgi:hypothetical protein